MRTGDPARVVRHPERKRIRQEDPPARRPGTRTGGKPLLTFRQIAAAIGAESEQAAQGRYRRKVGNPSSSESGNDGTP